MKKFNTLDEVYKNGYRTNAKTGAHTCTVCGKTLKTESKMESHVNTRLCHDYKDIFMGTVTEADMFKIFQCVSQAPQHSKAGFRKNRWYNIIARFWLFCYNNRIQDKYDYMMFVLKQVKYKHLTQGVQLACKQEYVSKWFKHRMINLSEDESETFWDHNKTILCDDIDYCLRSLERGDITIEVLFSHLDTDDFIDRLTPPQYHRLCDITKMLEVT